MKIQHKRKKIKKYSKNPQQLRCQTENRTVCLSQEQGFAESQGGAGGNPTDDQRTEKIGRHGQGVR